ncbi:MAG: ORF6N domain-containing protein [Bacilli bacterium]|nr:ORF6N domain-containing protein [Bacilli bacterium]
MNEAIEKENVKIENMIYEIRGVQVMLDSDLAKLFKIETGNLNKAMKRNIERFPIEFCFKLNNNEYNSLLFQIGIAKSKGGRTNLPFVYSEQGIAMISSVLHSEIAIQMSIKIINTFVAMRHYLIDNKDIYKSINNINNKLLEHDDKFEFIFSKFDKKEQLILPGQAYDSYSNVLHILKDASNEIIIIDPYADPLFLDLIRNIKVNIILITKDSNRLSNIEINKYNSQYHNLEVIRDNSFHDRYFIIDRKYLYLLGSSINNLGNKTSTIVKLEDDAIKNILLKNIKKIIH